MEESGHPRLHWKQEAPGSNPGYPTIEDVLYLIGQAELSYRRVDRKWERAAL